MLLLVPFSVKLIIFITVTIVLLYVFWPHKSERRICNPVITKVSKLIQMAHNIIQIDFTPCSPAPINGYHLFYRIKGSADVFRDGGLFVASPAIIDDNADPAGTLYEGYLQSDCGDGILGTPIHWANTEGGGGGGTPTCTLYSFTVFGADSDLWSINGTACNGSAVSLEGIVGDGNPANLCLQDGTLVTTGNIIASTVGSC